MGQLLDVLDVVEEATTLNLFNTPTDNPNNEMGQSKTWKQMQLLKRWRKMPTQMKLNNHSSDERMETCT